MLGQDDPEFKKLEGEVKYWPSQKMSLLRGISFSYNNEKKKCFCNLPPWGWGVGGMLVVSSSNVQLDYFMVHLPEACIKWTNFLYSMILEAG